MSNIKVAIKIRPIIKHELKLSNEEQWISTDTNSLRCIDSLHACNFAFGKYFRFNQAIFIFISDVKQNAFSCSN